MGPHRLRGDFDFGGPFYDLLHGDSLFENDETNMIRNLSLTLVVILISSLPSPQCHGAVLGATSPPYEVEMLKNAEGEEINKYLLAVEDVFSEFFPPKDDEEVKEILGAILSGSQPITQEEFIALEHEGFWTKRKVLLGLGGLLLATGILAGILAIAQSGGGSNSGSGVSGGHSGGGSAGFLQLNGPSPGGPLGEEGGPTTRDGAGLPYGNGPLPGEPSGDGGNPLAILGIGSPEIINGSSDSGSSSILNIGGGIASGGLQGGGLPSPIPSNPEPSTWVLLGLGLFFPFIRRRQS